MKTNISQGVISGSVTMLSGRFLVMALGFVQFLLVAHFFGTSGITDAYFVAQVIPMLFIGIIEPALNHTFVPVFIDYKEKEGESEAWRIGQSLFWIACMAMLAGVVLYVALSSPIIAGLGSGFSAEIHQYAVRLTISLSPVMVLSVLSAVLSSIYFAYRHFKTPIIGGLFPVTLTVLSILFFAEKIWIYSIPAGMVAGGIAQFIYLYLHLPQGLTFRLNKVFPLHRGVRRTGRLLGPRLLTLGLVKIDTMVDRFFASFLVVGSVTALHYAERLVFSIPTVILSSLGKVLMPILSRHGTRGELGELRTFLSRAMRMMGAIIIPISVLIFFYHEPLIQIIFERGSFDSASTHLTSIALIFYDVGLLFFALNPILNIVFFSMQDTVTPFRIGLFLSILNLVLDFVLVKHFAHGGLALATSLVAMTKTFFLVHILSNRVGSFHLAGILLLLGKVLFASLATVTVLKGARMWAPDMGFSFIDQTASGTIMLTLFGISFYFFICYMLRVREYSTVVLFLGKKIQARFFQEKH